MKRNWRSYVIMGLIICLTGSLTMLPASADMVIQPLPSLDDITDVNAPSPNDGDILVYDAGIGLWINVANNVTCNLTDIQNQVNGIANNVTILQNGLVSINATVVDQGNNITTLFNITDDIYDDITAINATLNGQVANITILQGQVATLVSDVSTLQSEYSSLNSTVESLITTVNLIQSDVSTLQNDVSDLQDAVADLEDRMDAAEDDIASNSGNITGLKNIAIQVFIGDGDSEITTGVKWYQPIPCDCIITTWILLADQSGSIIIDVWKDTYANFPPTVADTITGSEKPTLSAAQKNQDLSLGTWTTSVSAGDVLAFNVDSCSTITRVTLTITATRVI